VRGRLLAPASPDPCVYQFRWICERLYWRRLAPSMESLRSDVGDAGGVPGNAVATPAMKTIDRVAARAVCQPSSTRRSKEVRPVRVVKEKVSQQPSSIVPGFDQTYSSLGANCRESRPIQSAALFVAQRTPARFGKGSQRSVASASRILPDPLSKTRDEDHRVHRQASCFSDAQSRRANATCLGLSGV
jgi:hypothetical protein